MRVAVRVVVCWTVTPIQVSNSLKLSGSPAQEELTTIELNMLTSRGSAAKRFIKLFIRVLLCTCFPSSSESSSVIWDERKNSSGKVASADGAAAVDGRFLRRLSYFADRRLMPCDCSMAGGRAVVSMLINKEKKNV